jgi:hypothetical protein
VERTLTIVPSPLARRIGNAAAVTIISPFMLPAVTSSIIASVSSSTGPNRPTPATLKR